MGPGPTPDPAPAACVAVLHVNAACLVWGLDIALPHCLSPSGENKDLLYPQLSAFIAYSVRRQSRDQEPTT